jgi:hypothetical protein
MIPTVRIADGKGGYIIINEADFDAATQTLYSDVTSPEPTKAKGGKAKGATVVRVDAQDGAADDGA